MKKFKFPDIAPAILIMLSLSFGVGCQTNQKSPSEQELTFKAHLSTQTRVAETNWDTGDVIGIFMTDASSGGIIKANKRYVTSTSEGLFSALEHADRIVLSAGEKVDLWGYYPYSIATEGFSVPVDISDQSNQSALDLLHASLRDVTSFAVPPTFNFSRQMARVVFNVTAGRGISSLSGLEATVSGVPTLATFDAKSGTVTTNSESTEAFAAKITLSGGTARVEVTLLPASVPTITFALGSDTFVWKADRPLDAGSRYTYNLALTDRNSTVTPANSYFDTPVLPAGGVAAEKPNGSAATKYLTFPGTDLIYYEVDLPDRAGRNYQMLYDSKELIAYWIAYPMYSSIMGTGNRTDDWGYDPNIPQSLQQTLARSYGGGYDRGHQMPSADRNYNETVNRTTFYYTNMTPQTGSMNQGIWANLEDEVRNWARECDTLYVVTGASLTTLTNSTIDHVADNDGKQVGLPKYYYKALAKRDNNGTADPADDIFHTVAFKIDNAAVSGVFGDYRIPVAELEQQTGFTFFPQLPDASIKSTVEASKW